MNKKALEASVYEIMLKWSIPNSFGIVEDIVELISNSLVAKDEQKLGCLFCSDPDCHNECIDETDEEISLRMWEEWERYRDEKISENPHTRVYLDFPDWLKER